MPLFSRDDDSKQPQGKDIAPADGPHAAAYKSGSLEGIPASGRQRIARMKEDAARGFFTSDLSVNEFLLVKEAGFEPVGLVRRQLDLPHRLPAVALEPEPGDDGPDAGDVPRARAGDDADGGGGRPAGRRRDRRRAPGRSAATSGARTWPSSSRSAPRSQREGVIHRAPNGRPFTSDLSGQDFWTLLQAGYRPVGLVMGNCVYHVAHRGCCSRSSRPARTSSCSNFTQALYDARELAMERMQNEAEAIRRRGDRRRRDHREQPRLGLARDRVLRDRDSGDLDLRRS